MERKGKDPEDRHQGEAEIGEPMEDPRDHRDLRGFALSDSIDGFNLRELDAEVAKQKDQNVFVIAFSIVTGIIVATVVIMMGYFPPKDKNDPEMVFYVFIWIGLLLAVFITLIVNWYRNRKKDN